MKLRTFIDRPVLSAVISIVILLVGLIALKTLPVEQYPDIAPPTVMVMTSYPGASAETVMNSAIAPLEEAINGVENMDYMESTSDNTGNVTINIYFHQGTDPDMAAVFVQNRVSQALGSLPAEVTKIGVSVIKRQNSLIKVISVRSKNDNYDRNFLANYVDINIKPQLKRIQGVGDVVLLSDVYSMRIWLDPVTMSQHCLNPDDITAALAEQNIESATGSFGENGHTSLEYVMRYRGRRKTPEEFGNIVISATAEGEVLYLRDVAKIELGSQSYGYISGSDDFVGVDMLVYQIAGSNASAVVNKIDAMLDDEQSKMPDGMEIISMLSVNDFLYASIEEVIKSLILAIILVVLVVYFFLQDVRATLIPTAAIFVSIIGTFAFMAVAGFTINLLTLFALVLAIGTVVDNAIVVVEAVQTKLESGYSSTYHASVDAMDGVVSAILTATIVFMAVFIPVSMMGGTSGIFYTQFGITMAVAAGISALNAFTLSPALCAILLKPYVDSEGVEKDDFSARFRKRFMTGFNAVVEKYKLGVIFFVHHKMLSSMVIVVSLCALVFFMMTTKTGLVPQEDKGAIMVDVSLAPGTSLEVTNECLLKIHDRIKDIEEIESASYVAGYGLFGGSGSCYGQLTIKLRDWKYRPGKEHYVDAVIGKIMQNTSDIKDASIVPVAPPMINGYGTSNSLSFYMQDKASGDVHKFFEVAQDYLSELRKRPEISMAYSPFNPFFPQYVVDVDPAKCKIAGVSPGVVLSTMAGYYGGQYISNINRFSRVYRVMLQGDPMTRRTPESLNSINVRTNSGKMAPLGQFVTITKNYGPQSLTRFNMYNAISMEAAPASGYSSGDALNAIKEVAKNKLPRNYDFEFAGISREEARTSSSSLMVYGICIILIYLILCAFYESFLIPFAIIISVPCGIMGSFLFAKMFNLENNIYLQTSVIMLIGLLAKTAILITDYASTLRKSGMSINQAAVGAAKVRLRPILMTALTMIFGMIPLMFASGVGANGNSSLGTSAVGGMLIGTLVLLFLCPMLFAVFQTLQEKISPIAFVKPNWDIEDKINEVREMKKVKGEPDNTVKF